MKRSLNARAEGHTRVAYRVKTAEGAGMPQVGRVKRAIKCKASNWLKGESVVGGVEPWPTLNQVARAEGTSWGLVLI